MNNTKPWVDWIPGVLSKAQITRLLTEGYVENGDSAGVDHSALDLRLADEGYEMPKGCVKPFGERFLHSLQKDSFVTKIVSDANGHYTLSPRHTYLFKLRERISSLGHGQIWGLATAKSSVGRMDVLARLIVDGMYEYESFQPDLLKSGDLFLEITPMTFSVVVKPGISLVQLRLFKGPPAESRIDGDQLVQTILLADGGAKRDPSLSVDLTPDSVAGHPVCAFSASLIPEGGQSLPLWAPPKGGEAEKPAPQQFWKLETADAQNRLRIEKDRFYIIRSKELIWLPKGVAVYCRASDESIGEMRIHYAGFVHPFFGTNRDDKQRGTPLIFEVRGHDVNVNLSDGEKMARLEFYRMSEDCVSDANVDKEYGSQKLKLSKFFAEWPSTGQIGNDGFLK